MYRAASASFYDLLVFTNGGTVGKDYNALLCEAIDRLAGSRIKTNIRTGDEEQMDSFGLIDAAAIRRKHIIGTPDPAWPCGQDQTYVG
jgi:hypothetical protein